jgi:hypothetical protein
VLAPIVVRRSPLYRRRQPIYVTFDDGLSIADLPLVREHLSHLVNIRSVHFHTSVRIATLFAITSTITFAHLRAVKFNGRDPSADAVRHLLLGSPKLESMILGQWKGDFDRTFACAPTSLTSLEITTAFEDGYLSTLAKLPHLQQLCLPTQLRPKSLFLPAASPVSFPSLARLTLTWNDWWIKVNDSPIDEIPISLVQATPHVRVLQLEGYRGLDYYCERIITAIAAWPSTVLPQLQHIAFPQQQRRPDLRRVHKSLLAHLPQLLQNRPVHPFCVHLLVDAAELTSPESAVFQLPSVRLMVSPMRSMDELTVDEGLLRRMDLAASSITLSKSDMLQLIQAEQLRLETAAPAASEEEEEAREEKEA